MAAVVAERIFRKLKEVAATLGVELLLQGMVELTDLAEYTPLGDEDRPSDDTCHHQNADDCQPDSSRLLECQSDVGQWELLRANKNCAYLFHVPFIVIIK